MSVRAKGSWVVAHRFHKIADRKNRTEKCGTKDVRSVAVKVAPGSLVTMIQKAGYNAGLLSKQLLQTEWRKESMTKNFLKPSLSRFPRWDLSHLAVEMSVSGLGTLHPFFACAI